jgi:hypothetical protein
VSGSTAAGGTDEPRRISRQQLLFGGVYGTVLASALAAALDENGTPNASYDALWIFLSAVAAAAAHGYAHAIAHWAPHTRRVTAQTVRSVLHEWPLVAAVLPTVAALLGAALHWWTEDHAVNTAMAINTAALFGWGLWTARVARQSWATACRVGAMDVLLGLFIVAANILSH